MAEYIDQLNRKLTLPATPTRIISIVPSQTEFLFDLGLQEEVVGITKFCVHPKEWFQTKTRVGGTKKLDFEKIKSLAPDLIIGNQEENEREQVEELMKHYPVWMSNITTLNDAYAMMLNLGEITGRKEKAEEIQKSIENKFHRFREEKKNIPLKKKRVAYFIWNKPMMIAGNNTFIHHLLEVCGFENVFSETHERYPEISTKDLEVLQPELILLSSEPFPFKEQHIAEFRSICPKAQILLVDGEMFSWYGSRLLHAPDYFASLIQQL